MSRSQDKYPIELTCSEVLDFTIETLQEHLDLVVGGDSYTPENIWSILVSASAQSSTIEETCGKTERGPSANTVRNHLKDGLLSQRDLQALEAALNELLVAQLPSRIVGYRHRIAIDLVLLPYYGEPAEDPNEIRRSAAKRGTTRFHCYATAYVIKPNKRVTLALTYVQKDDTILGVLKRLLVRLETLNVGIRRLYLDRGFYSVEIIRFLKTQSFPAVLPAPVRGKRMKRLFTERKCYQTPYTVISPKHGKEEVNLWIVCRYAKGKRGKHQVEYLPYVVLGDLSCPIPNVREEHRGRFGIETSYRMMNQARARTTCRDPNYRLLLVGLALTLINIWITLKWTVLAVPRQGGRWIDDHLFPLSRFRSFLAEAVKTTYGIITSVQRPTTIPNTAPG